jgi:hypothetical protein
MKTCKTLIVVAVCLAVAGVASAVPPADASTALQIVPNPATLSGDDTTDVTFTTTTTADLGGTPVTEGHVILQWGSDGSGNPVPSTYAGTIDWQDFAGWQPPDASGQTTWPVDLDALFLPGTVVAIRANYAPAGGSGYREHKSDVQDLVITEEGTWVRETAWAAGLLYNPEGGGNWATYTPYYGESTTVTLYAGQTMEAGTVQFSAPAGGLVTITITLDAGWRFYDDPENVKIQDYDVAPSGNPSPGLFDTKGYATGSPFSINVPENNFYGVHVDVEWLDLGD